MIGPMTVVTGYVPTPEGDAALTAAIHEAQSRGLRLVVVNTSSGDALVDPRYVTEDQVPDLVSRLERSGVPHSFVHSLGGRDAADEVLAVAVREQAALLVIGLRRRSPVGKLVMGSTAQRILLGAECPVLAVKAPR